MIWLIKMKKNWCIIWMNINVNLKERNNCLKMIHYKVHPKFLDLHVVK